MTTGFTPTEIGIEQARKTLGDLLDRAYHHGVTTFLTRNGRRVAAIVPADRAEHHVTRRGTAQWDPQNRTIAVTPEYTSPGELGPIVINYDRPIDAYLTNALAKEGWRVANPDDIRRFQAGEPVAVVHIAHPASQAEQLVDWISRYGDRPAAVRGLPNGRIRYLLVDGAILEGDAPVLETADPNGALYERAAWPGVGRTLADLIHGTQRPWEPAPADEVGE